MRKRVITTLLVLLFLSIYLTNDKVEAEYFLNLGERVLKKGNEGADVAILQQKLKDIGIYQGKIDGLFGSATERAVRIFQQRNNLMVDGVVGKETLAHLPKYSLISRMDISRNDIILLARIIHGEARGESFKGMVAVGAVILNRVESPRFPDSIRGVILQKGQFSSLIDGQANLYPSREAIYAAKAALLGYDPTFGSLFFYNPRVATNLAWISSRPVATRIGGHLFAR